MQVCYSSGVERDGTVKRSEVVNLLIAEYDYNTDIEVQREEAFGQGEAKGRAEGKAEGMNLLNSLMKLLIRGNRYDDLKRAVEDPYYQKELIKEYGIIE